MKLIKRFLTLFILNVLWFSHLSIAEECMLYGVQDEGVNDSQFFSVDPQTGDVNLLGGLYEGEDIEALAMHPSTGELYAATGDQSNNPGVLYKVDQSDASLMEIMNSGFIEINSLAFDPSGDLWSWGLGNSGYGLYYFDIINSSITQEIADRQAVEDIAWTSDERILASENGTLYIYSQSQGDIVKTCPLPGETEALEMFSDNLLLLGVHGNNDLSIQVMDIDTCGLIPAEAIITQFNDVEGLALSTTACSVRQTINVSGEVSCNSTPLLTFTSVEVEFNQDDNHVSGEFAGTYSGKTVYIIFSGTYVNQTLTATIEVYLDPNHTFMIAQEDFSGTFDDNGYLQTTTTRLPCTVNLTLNAN